MNNYRSPSYFLVLSTALLLNYFTGAEAGESESQLLLTLESEIGVLENQLISLESKLSRLKSLEKLQTPAVTELNRKLIDRQKRLIFLKTKIISDPELSVTGMHAITKSHINDLDEEIIDLTRKLNLISPEHTGINSKILSTNNDISSLKESINSKKRITSELRTQRDIEKNRAVEIALLRDEIDRLKSRSRVVIADQDQETTYEVTETLLEKIIDLQSSEDLALNGKKVKIITEGSEIKFLGANEREQIVKQGLNSFSNENLAKSIIVWVKGLSIKELVNPYENSFAILAAIDKYKDVEGYVSLDNMVKNAQRLKERLVEFGFPEENIVLLADDKVTAQGLRDSLNRFLLGRRDGKKADRIFFYYGGHGDHLGDIGYLVTSDFDPSNPLGSSFKTKSFTAEYFYTLDVKHFLVAIDSCSAGLAIDGMTTLGGGGKPAESIIGAAHIETEYKNTARELLVAGVSDEKAIWLKDGGGLFTQALVKSLTMDKWGADANGDGVIRVSEVSNYIDDIVRSISKDIDTLQTPRYWRSTIRHKGSMLFVPDAQ